MHQKCELFLFYMCTTVSISLAFNIDLRDPEVYNGSADDFFGFKVLQVGSKSNKEIVVTAPLYNNGSGAVYLGRQNHKSPFTAKAVTVGAKELPVKHFGLSIAKDLTQHQLTVCSPNVVVRCNENSYMNSVCYNLTEQLEEQSVFKPAFQDCTKKTVDLAFLFDGSLSMTEKEFEENKYFIEDIMSNLKNTSIKFAAVQFSTEVRTVFTFNDYTEGTASTKLKKEPQLRSLTNTHKALDFVLKEHLNNTSSGASLDATKVLVLITDGDPSDSDRAYGSIMKYDSMGIIRLVIGVKKVDVTKLKLIASEPKDNNTFHIENYNGLTGVLENFQKKIFQTEGSKAALAGDLTEEMSQTGFSAVYGKDTLLLGSVGSQTWRGSLHELQGKTETQIQDSEQKEDSYMGYSVSVGEKNTTALYFTGAPRYQHMGQVVLFTSTAGKWTPTQRINGEQHGSYFGAEVCSVDVDSDGNTDFLFVGAPLFYQTHHVAEGKIYIYKLTHDMKLIKLHNITAHVMGRFGTTIASVADVNGDGLRDAVVGAPLENQNRGAVYLYLGDRTRGIRSTHSQRILGENVHPKLQLFGQSIDGSIDVGNDGLPDLLIGSRGSAVVLKSKPVFNITTHLMFDPHEIHIDKIKCPSNNDDFIPLVTLTVCFQMVEATKSSAGAVKPGLNISYFLDVDPMRQTFRGFFNSTTKKRNLTETYELIDKETCFNHSVYMLKCVTDTLSPIEIHMNFSQMEIEKADVALNSDSDKETSVEVPFEKRCHNDTCIAEIEVDFDFMTPSLVVADHNYFNVSVTLFNRGEDSYNTSLTIYHSLGLSFARMSLAQDSKSKPLYSCRDYEDRTLCGVSLPVYRSQSQAKFMSVFHVIREYEWKESLSVNITGHSDNQNSSKGSVVKDIPVQFEIKMVLLVHEDSITYMNFTTEHPAPRTLVTKYTVENYGWRHFPVNVTLVFPTKLEHGFEMMNYKVLIEQNTTQCRESDLESPSSQNNYCTPERECKYIVCDPFLLTNASVEFELSGQVQFKDLSQLDVPFLKRYTGDGDMIEFESFLFVAYDTKKYSLDSYNQKRKRESPDDSFGEDIEPVVKSSEVLIELIVLPDTEAHHYDWIRRGPVVDNSHHTHHV
ncbi:hypothetical protein NQD34_000525 [Periophthalmus magnuspinnatus]|nr:hypothetical protein NQD34_000525 [Periophthalmus magnuspinnatus]